MIPKQLLLGFLLGLALVSPATAATNAPRPTVIVVVGAAGEEEFGKQFAEWSAKWTTAAAKASAKSVLIGTSKEP